MYMEMTVFVASVEGIPGELYYVRAGIINDYALSFNLPIKSDVDVIYFDWQNLGRSPPDTPVSRNTVGHGLVMLLS